MTCVIRAEEKKVFGTGLDFTQVFAGQKFAKSSASVGADNGANLQNRAKQRNLWAS